MVSIRWPQWPRLLTAWGRGKYKLQITDSHCAALFYAQTGTTENGDDFGKADVTMTVKMSNDASLLCRGSSEIDGKHSAAGLEDSSNLGGTLAA